MSMIIALLLATSAAELEWRHADLEQLYVDGKFDEGLTLAKHKIGEQPKDAHLYGHAARFIYEIGERYKRTDQSVDKAALYEEMHALLSKGVALEPDHPQLLFGLGVAKARLATTKGILASLGSAKEIEGLWLRVAKDKRTYRSKNGENQLPCDAQLTLGIFYRLLPDWWIVEVLAGVRGDVDKSLRFLEDANRCGPHRIRTLKELGVAQLCAGKKKGDDSLTAKGKATLAALLSMPPRLATEKIDVRHAKMLLGDPALACAYSRDGQQELDEKKL